MARTRNVASTSSPAQNITEVTFTGLPDGMMPAFPAHEIPDTGCRMLVDGFVHNPGLVTRRGPVDSVQTFSSTLPYPGCGLVSVVDPQGRTRVAAVHGDASHGYLGVYATDFTSRADLPLGINLGQAPYQVVKTAPRIFGGVYISIQDKAIQGATQRIFLWAGSGKQAYSTGTVTVSIGSTNVVGTGTAWAAGVDPGAFLVIAGVYAGTVKTVNSDGVVTLDKGALVSGAGSAYVLSPTRGVVVKVAKGYITTDVANATVNGANTKFLSDGLGTGTWFVYRSSDNTLIGTVSSVTSDIQLTLGSNATLTLSQEPYTAYRVSTSPTNAPTGFGVSTTQWAGRQVYANQSSSMENTSKLWFSSVDDAEALDEAATDGDFLLVPSIGPAGTATPIVAMEPTPTSLLLLKENEAYGLYGQSTSQFQILPVLSDDGCLSPMSVQSWNGLVVFAGRQGVYMFDGQTAQNVTQETLGWWYQSAVANFDATQKRMWSMVDRDHYFLFIEQAEPPIPILKGSTAVPLPSMTLAVHLPTGACTVLRNVDIRGSLRLPSVLGHNTWYLVTNSSAQGVICSADTLFDSAGNDTFACAGNTAGPDFYLETKKYTFGDSLLKKLWKMILLTYTSTGDTLKLDTVPGLNEIGTTSATQFPASGLTWGDMAALGLTWTTHSAYPTWASPADENFITKRIKFLKRAQMMSFRIYQNSSSVKALVLGPWSLVAKAQRIGRT